MVPLLTREVVRGVIIFKHESILQYGMLIIKNMFNSVYLLWIMFLKVTKVFDNLIQDVLRYILKLWRCSKIGFVKFSFRIFWFIWGIDCVDLKVLIRRKIFVSGNWKYSTNMSNNILLKLVHDGFRKNKSHTWKLDLGNIHVGLRL